jgi:O-methyltransferase involved in polyketide biosynthesis
MNNPADQTALGPMVIVAAEQYEPSPLIHDPTPATFDRPVGRMTASKIERAVYAER